ncbi:universal stress protein [Streptomyces sp. Ru71]|uniref:universal stress protein n=1 Tax=Streptomyces sp. Ru71 TaxID=2080746 RepID=UPI000CDE1C4A|nr:universal stress protein [Streptomyces sp. Ru71]POX52560.1 universal stress protein [Streptomyces sp. Ru71]
MELPLVVGVDGSLASAAALDWAVDEAVRHGLTLLLVHASLWERYESTGMAHRDGPPRAPAVVEAAAERAQRRDPRVSVATDVAPEDPVDALVSRGHDAFAVVIGARGHGGLPGLLLGSVGFSVAAHAPCPVIVVRGDRAGLAGAHERILLGVGGPEAGTTAVRFAFREAEARCCRLDAVHAWRRPVHVGDRARLQEERAAAVLDTALRDVEAAHRRVPVRRATVEGPAHTVLVHFSAAEDLVVVGARHRSGRRGLQLGRVAHALLHHARCPVAVVPQPV